MPVIGAAVEIAAMERLRNWLFERERDVEIQDFFWPELLDGDGSPLAERYAALLDGHRGRIGIHGPFWGFSVDSFDPKVREIATFRLGQGLDVAAALGATQMVVHSPFTNWDAQNLAKDPGARDGLFERAHMVLDPIVRRAEDQGVELVIENIEDRDPRDRVELARSFDSEAVRVSVDTGHAHYAHGSTGAPPVDHYVIAAGNMLRHVHLQDADGYADRHWAIGEGTILWPSVFQALAGLSSNPRLILELKDHGRIVDSVERLEAMGLGA